MEYQMGGQFLLPTLQTPKVNNSKNCEQMSSAQIVCFFFYFPNQTRTPSQDTSSSSKLENTILEIFCKVS